MSAVSGTRARRWAWTLAVGVAAVIAVILGVQWRRNALLRQKAETARLLQHDQEPVRLVRERLAEKEISPADRERLRKRAAELAPLHAEVQALKVQVEAAEKLAVRPDAKPHVIRPTSELGNAGRSRPENVVQTSLWAAAGGDLDALAAAIYFDPSAKTRAEELLATLPAGTDPSYASAEKLIAMMMSHDLLLATGLGDIQVNDFGDGRAQANVEVGTGNGKTEKWQFALHHSGDNWQLLVNDELVDRYARELKAGAPTK